VKKALRPLQVDIAEAENSQAALQMIAANGFDVIISDLEMPGMDGISLCRQLKEDVKCHAIPVVITSALDSDKNTNDAFHAGASAYVSKNDGPSRLRQVVEQILSRAAFYRERLVLVVDDSRTTLRIVQKGLEQSGFQVLIAQNGKEAMKTLTYRRPDLIISDIDMPEMNGFELCSAIKSNPEWGHIPFVVMSANADRSHMRRMLQEGAASYICKPFNIDQLVILVERILSDHFQLLLKEKERLDGERLFMISSITSLVQALEARDAYTRGHSEAVAEVVAAMVALTGASKTEIERATIGGRLHDIGKIGVADHILLKPGQLTNEEFAEIKKHPQIGEDIIKPIPSFADILPIIASHHERFDGKGYPRGLKGSQIHFWARITAVADTYHALVSDRPYRKGMPQAKALQIITDASGTQLCPECVDLFFEWIDTQ
jgi:response regulator RpfG family c-di-GMP phosphodiesterase